MRSKINYIIQVVLFGYIVMQQSVAGTSMEDFFPEVFEHGNLSEITWDHAVNSQELLTTALANDKHMIEADVLLGYLSTTPNVLTVIMGHPPARTSDLSLQQFLSALVAHNAQMGNRKKGVKLDFKDSDAYARALTANLLLVADGSAFREEYTAFPMWLNGDIAPGPASTSNGVDLQLSMVKSKPALMNAAVWSLGWTTGDYQEGMTYTAKQIDAMKRAALGIQNITFPVRAMYAAKSRSTMVSLLDVGTLTVWSGKQDDAHVDVPELAKLIADYLDRVYVDVPDTLWQRVRAAMP